MFVFRRILCFAGAITAMSVLAPVGHAADYSTKSTGCPDKVAHEPAADVEYQAGVDGKGWAVAPADLTPPVLTRDDFTDVKIPLRFPVTELEGGRGAPAANPSGSQHDLPFAETMAEPGTISVDAAEGTVRFNDKDITPLDPAEMNPDCWE